MSTNTSVLPFKGDTWRHTKSGGIYLIEGIAHDSETKAPMVVYRHTSTGALWVRPLMMFKERVTVDDQSVQRFTLHSRMAW